MKTFTAIDFETAVGKRYSACAVGIVKVVNNEITETFSTLIQPPNNEYHYMNTSIHGISAAMTINSPTFLEVYPKIKSLINNTLVVAHNASFDISVLNKAREYYGIVDELNYDLACTLKIYGKKLNVCCKENNINLNHHDALSDALACAKLYLLCADDIIEQVKLNQKPSRSVPKNGGQKICGDVLKPDLENVENKENPFFCKKVVISGTYDKWPDRKDLAAILKNMGADIDTGITKKTNFLIAGKGVGPSKMNKMQKNIDEGKEAYILNEEMVSKMLL